LTCQALSSVGRCQTFDAAADGYGRGEAIVAMVLHSAAAGPPQPALALMCGSAVNQDGRSSSLTSPNGPSQQVTPDDLARTRHSMVNICAVCITAARHAECCQVESLSIAQSLRRRGALKRDLVQALVASALVTSGWEPSSVAALAVHGTGTPLGDPIEVSALAGALATGKAPGPPVMASVKARVPFLVLPSKSGSWGRQMAGHQCASAFSGAHAACRHRSAPAAGVFRAHGGRCRADGHIGGAPCGGRTCCASCEMPAHRQCACLRRTGWLVERSRDFAGAAPPVGSPRDATGRKRASVRHGTSSLPDLLRGQEAAGSGAERPRIRPCQAPAPSA